MVDSELEYLQSGGLNEIQANQQASSQKRQKQLVTDAQSQQITKAFREDGSTRTLIKALKTDWIKSLIYLDGTNFDFSGRRYLEQIYNTNHPHKLLITGRQVEKSSLLANEIIINSIVIPYFKSLYVSPSHDQSRQFSNGKLKPWVEDSPLIQKYFQNTSVSKQVFEKSFTNGSITFLRSAFLSADRCVAEGTEILLKDGSQQPVESMQPLSDVVSYDMVSPVSSSVYEVGCNGIKPTLTITTVTGHRMCVSHNHRCVTNEGLKRADTVTTNDWVPLPFDYVPSSGKDNVELRDETLASWLGLMLSDGCWARGKRKNDRNYFSASFCNNDFKLMRRFQALSHKLGLKTTTRSRTQGDKINYSVSVRPQHKLKSLLINYSLLGTKGEDKFIPEEFFKSRRLLSAILRGLFEGDGWVTFNKKNGQAEIGFVTGSIRLADDVRRALFSLGIYCIEETNKTPVGRVKKPFHVIKVRNQHYMRKFYKDVGFYTKQKKLKTAIETCGLIKTSARRVDVPARNDCLQALKKCGVSLHALWEKHRCSFRCNKNSKTAVAVHKVEKIYELTRDATLLRWTNPNVVWVRVKSIEDSGFKKTYDLSITSTEIFTANGIFVHNTRGISADLLCLDEIQDILTSNIPVITETLSHSKYGYKIFAGTPKTLENSIQQFFELSSMCEWLVPCRAHSPPHWNYLDEKCIGKEGPICNKCGKPINPSDGKWIAFNNSRDILGFRIAQIMVPWIYQNPLKWKDFIWKYEHLSRGIFYNECLGISYDSASKPITRTELIECCSSSHPFRPRPDNFTSRVDVFAGVDWGEGTDGSERGAKGRMKNASYTVLSLGLYLDPTHFHYFFVKRYEGDEALPGNCIGDIINVLRAFGVKCAGVDWGHGWGVNERLEDALGFSRVIKLQYVGNQRERKKFDSIGIKYQLSRTEVMTDFFTDIKDHKFVFPPWESVKDFLCDIEHVYAEYGSGIHSLKYDHKPSEPDDALHSMIYCREAADNYYGKAR